MDKPDWKDAPERAKFLAQDHDGSWFWFELEPYIHNEGLWATYGSCWVAVENPDWRESLEPRP